MKDFKYLSIWSGKARLVFEIQSMKIWVLCAGPGRRVSEWSVQRSDYTECRPRSRGLGHWWQLPPPPPDTPEPAPEELEEREREEPPTSRNLPVFIEQGMFCHQLGWAPRAGRSWRESESERSRGILIWTNTITTQTKWHFFWTISIEVWLLHSKMLFASV